MVYVQDWVLFLSFFHCFILKKFIFPFLGLPGLVLSRVTYFFNSCFSLSSQGLSPVSSSLLCRHLPSSPFLRQLRKKEKVLQGQVDDVDARVSGQVPPSAWTVSSAYPGSPGNAIAVSWVNLTSLGWFREALVGPVLVTQTLCLALKCFTIHMVRIQQTITEMGTLP